MKRLLPLLILLIGLGAINTASAQLTPGSTAPDFTGVDLDGNSHTLYTYLDDGKIAILDFSTTWCGPCWSYHVAGTLEDLYHDFGPDGADVLRVFMLESDASTTLADLQGTTAGTQGDWITGTDYPIIDDDAPATAYGVTAYPTVIMVRPDYTVQAAGQNTYESWVSEIVAIGPTPSAAINPGMSSYSGATASCTSSIEFEVVIANFGSDPLTAATIEAKDNTGNVIATVNWTGNLATWASETVTFPSTALSSTIDVTFEVIVAGDAVTGNNTVDVTIGLAPTSGVAATLEIVFDNYASETSWEVANGAGTVVYSGSGYANGDAGITEAMTLDPNDCYEFKISDSYGDGICCGFGAGSFTVTDDVSGDVIFTGGEFTAEDKDTWSTSSTGVAVEQLNIAQSVKTYPNPADASMVVKFNLTQDADISIAVSNAFGQVVSELYTGNMSAGSQALEVNTASLANGAYFLTLRSEDAVSTHRFVVTH